MKPVALFAFLLLVADGPNVNDAVPQKIDVNVRSKIDSLPFLLRDSVNAFNNKMFQSLTAVESGNFVFSPFGLHVILSQAYVGAPSGTTTSDELAALLSIKSNDANNEAYLYNYLRVIDFLHQGSML